MTAREPWDAVAIGSGLGSLSAAAALARRGRRVLVLERLANFGGAATVYRHGPLAMEASLHEIDGATVDGPHGVFSRLGLREAVHAVPTAEFYEARGGALAEPVRVPQGLEAAGAAVAAAHPEARAHVEGHFAELGRLFRTFRDLEDMGARGPQALLGLLFSGRFFELIGDARKSLAQALDARFKNSEPAKFSLGAILPYFDDDPAVMSFLLYAGVWARYCEAGSYYIDGGSSALVRALLATVKSAGGDARRKCEVKRVLLAETGAVAGVAYIDERGAEREAFAPTVLGGAAPSDLAAMLPAEKRKEFKSDYKAFESSISLFSLSLGLTRPAAEFGVGAYSTFVYPDDMSVYADYPTFASVFAGDPAGRMPPYGIADYGRLSGGLAQPEGLHLVSLASADRLSWWDGLSEDAEKDRRARWRDALIADLDRRFPGMAGAVSHAEIATARTMQTRLGSPHGEVYGFRPTPERVFSKGPKPETSVPGLFLSSAFTVSGGYAGAMHGGLTAADAATRRR